MSFVAPLNPPSVNALYNVFRYGSQIEVKIKPEVTLFKSRLKIYVPKWDWKHEETDFLFFNMTLFDKEFFFKNGKPRRFDITNTEKAVLDAICDKIGIDDSYVKERRLRHEATDGQTYMEIEVGVLA